MKQLRRVSVIGMAVILMMSLFLLIGCDNKGEATVALAENVEIVTQEEGQAGNQAEEESKEKGPQIEEGEQVTGESSLLGESDTEEGDLGQGQTDDNEEVKAGEGSENEGNMDAGEGESGDAANEQEEASERTTVHLVAAGDDLLHETVIKGGLQEDGSYDYSCFFLNLLDIFENADIAAINQETIMGGEDKGYSGYPLFNSPDALALAIHNAGFDVVLQANNHTLDMGISGLAHAISVWEEYPDITLLGVHKTKEEYENIQTISCNGITIAMLNYTYGFNGNILPSEDYYMAERLDKDKMAEDIKKAKEIADFVIVFPHWGTEYVYKPDASEEDLAQFFADQGVDLVIGGHPHVLQTAQWLTGEDGNQTFVYYSLGNYISSMNYTDRMLGGLADVVIAKEGEETYLESAHIIPIVTHYERGEESNFGVYRLTDYTEEMAEKHFIYGTKKGADFSLSKLWELTNEIVGEWIE